MTEEGPGSATPSRSHEVFLRFLRARERDASLEFEAWLATPDASDVGPSLAAELRGLESARRGIDQALAPRKAGGARGDALGSDAGTSLVRGSQIGDFVLEARIGAGAMGEVWKATQVSLKRPVALKFMRRGLLDEHRLEFFAREARAGARLAHPGIVAVYGTGEEGSLRWIAMELVPGGRTLADRLRELRTQGELPSEHEDAAHLVLALAEALEAAHEQGVIHRDLKPGNVLLDEAGRPKIGDFGLAKLVDELSISREGEMAGTYAYMSPEQISAKAVRIDRRTDVFSLGVVFYELLTLAKPFEGDTPEQVKLKICLHQPPDPRAMRSRVPADLATIALKCLEKEPGRRYASMRELGDDVRRFLRREPIVARAPSRLRRAELWIRRNPTASAVVGVVAAALAVVTWLLAHAVQREARLLELGDLRQVRMLIEEADLLWPAVPERIPAYESWLARAETLIHDLDRHRRTQRELEARARPRTEEEAHAESQRHPEYARLVAARGELEVLKRAEAVSDGAADASAPATPDPRAAEYASESDPTTCLRVAETLASPERTEFGKEALALALAQRALPRLREDQRREARIVSAWALSALGRAADAEAEARAALAELPSPNATFGLRQVQLLCASLARARTPEGRAENHARIEALESEVTRLSSLASERRIWPFDHPDDAWLHEGISTVVLEIEAFSDPARGVVAGVTPEHGIGVRKRLESARTIVRRSLEEPAERWREAVEAIADPSRSPLYAGLRIAPQLGLIPLACAPESGLWEFLDVESGAEPPRDEFGQIVPTAEMGVVFVLIPGGTAVLGVQNVDRDAPRYDPTAPETYASVQRVELDPYFVSKYEMTQAQWKRLTGANPSQHPAGTVQLDRMTTETHPVELVSWVACARVLERQGWRLPSEAQWEYAARAGTDTRWWTGDDVHGVEGAENLSDVTVSRYFASNTTIACESWLDDGWLFHSPVGSFRANGFGLYDVIGNVSEWCRDGRRKRWRPLRRGDGEIEASESNLRTVRGGCSVCAVVQGASWYFLNLKPALASDTIGVRTARALQR